MKVHGQVKFVWHQMVHKVKHQNCQLLKYLQMYKLKMYLQMQSSVSTNYHIDQYIQLLEHHLD